MQEENKQPGLSWSMPSAQAPAAPSGTTAPANPAGNSLPAIIPSVAAAAAGGKKILHTQAPVYAGLLVGGIIVGVLLSTAWPFGQGGEAAGAATSTSQAAQASTTAPAPAKTTPTAPALVVSDQPAGPSVAISGLNIARPTWVVVYVSREGSPGNALGARLFFAGDKQGKVGLLRSTQPGQSYFAGLAVDDGDRAFSLSKDLPLADADGGPLWATFRAL